MYLDIGLMFRLYFDFRPLYHVPPTLGWTWHTLELTLLKAINFYLVKDQPRSCIALCNGTMPFVSYLLFPCDLGIVHASSHSYWCLFTLLWSPKVVFIWQVRLIKNMLNYIFKENLSDWFNNRMRNIIHAKLLFLLLLILLI